MSRMTPAQAAKDNSTATPATGNVEAVAVASCIVINNRRANI